MEPPLLLRILLPLASLSWLLLLLLARGSAATGVIGGIGAHEDEWSRQPAAAHLILGDSRNAQARRLLQSGKNEHPQPPTHAPPPNPNPNQKKPKTNERPHRPKHHRHKMHAPSPSPFSSAPKALPSPSASAPAISSSGSLHPLAAPPRLLISSSPSISPPHKHSSRNYSLVAAGSAVFVVMAAASVMYCRVKKVGTVRPWATGLSGQLQRAFVTGVPALKRSELEAACEDFSNIVGSTPSCMLYKGTLSSGVEIAVVSSSVTSVKDWSKECESHYRKKITSLSKVSHKNFMNLLGYCEEDQPFTRAMVFEYAPNGTLFEHLHVREADNLNWATRLRISMGIA
ncbi:hypothetical protein BDA96_02G449500 [Sorghum bicolor]|uniref:Serine-threonine/tyrosine-protein kinase catalytic domain-containing protein n=2 Tax=Sorghum bicolor TaxID=4558 RepID=A0A921UYJ2_SORBI|nr:hypothetical protein SORBI_3002G428900 [Sorghum bicolor]KAG0546461.1 hypothetical protein BDA96_02G449500 [Sorghum bicolor]